VATGAGREPFAAAGATAEEAGRAPAEAPGAPGSRTPNVESITPRVLAEVPVFASDPAASLPAAVGPGLLAVDADGTVDLLAVVADGLLADAGAGFAGSVAARPTDGAAHSIRQAAPSSHPAAAA